MSAYLNWQAANAQYLSAALAWLRACLESDPVPAPGPLAPFVSQTKEVPKSFWHKIVGGHGEPVANSSALPPASRNPNRDGRVAQAAADLKTAGSRMDPPPALTLMSRRLGLSKFEEQVLLLCIGMELDSGIAALCSRAQGDSSRPYPTFALAFTIFEEPAWEALSPERPLRYWRLIEISQPGGQILTVSPLRADERIVNYAKGLNYLDDRLTPLVTRLDVPAARADIPASQRLVIDAIVRGLQQSEVAPAAPVVELLGTDSASKQLTAGRVADSLGLRLYRLSLSLLPTATGDLETLARLWQRESLLLPVALYLETQGSAAETPSLGSSSSLARFLDRLDGLVFLDTREVWSGLTRPCLSLDVNKPIPSEQEVAWRSAFGAAAGESPALLAGQFNLGLATIQQIVQQVVSDSATDNHALHERLWDACLTSTRPRLNMLAQRIVPKASWDNIVLPAAEASLLRQISEQVAQRSTVYEKWGFERKMSRGLGISALFAGESGTGKTMAAEVLANELRLNLYRIDLSAVVSKYIGETEKNLRRLFDAAEDGGVILFFDEADALFGKRSEVKDSHDRYANIEINYLLQRMEAFRGLAILATNMKSVLDPAFLRRLRFVVNFQFPGAVERRAIWQKVFPAETPVAGLDFDRLARLNLTGGHIHNIALNAAFRAAHTGTPVGMLLVLEAARTELRKLERPINEMDFRWQAVPGAVA
jgi:hypothetical protein